MLKTYKRQQVAGFFLLAVLTAWFILAVPNEGISNKVIIIVAIHLSGLIICLLLPMENYDLYIVSASFLLMGSVILSIICLIFSWGSLVALSQLGIVILSFFYGGTGYKLFDLKKDQSLI